jgi:hypothetical protein
MKFSALLIEAIRTSEIPLRFEPGAEEAVARPVTEFLRMWLSAHSPEHPQSDFDFGKKAILAALLEELDDVRSLG